ncbi:hypothetical protein CW703_03410 [Candidatus Bathyarchaeota archaeon]|nr:MAG: hypothetical protein CW703_03410 [Candidatus Bathyarchaeota archaeon]
MRFLKNLVEVFTKIKHGGKGRIACPRCGSLKIHLVSSLDGWLTPTQYFCEECGYKGPLVLRFEEK